MYAHSSYSKAILQRRWFCIWQGPETWKLAQHGLKGTVHMLMLCNFSQLPLWAKKFHLFQSSESCFFPKLSAQFPFSVFICSYSFHFFVCSFHEQEHYVHLLTWQMSINLSSHQYTSWDWLSHAQVFLVQRFPNNLNTPHCNLGPCNLTHVSNILVVSPSLVLPPRAVRIELHWIQTLAECNWMFPSALNVVIALYVQRP